MNKVLINYKKLRKISVEAARTAIIEYLTTNGGNISDCAKAFGIQRLTVYNILKKSQEGDLMDRSKAPRKVANKTPEYILSQILEAKQETGFGPTRLTKYLLEHYNIEISYGTLRGILKRSQIKQ